VKVLLTGGSGFLGGYVARDLLAAGHQVTSLGRRPQPELAALGATCLELDLLDSLGLQRAARDQDGVIHAAARTGVWGPKQEYRQTNVIGTLHVYEACRRAGVRRLVYTSSPSVCFDGRDQRGAGNDLPYAQRFLAAYPESKAEAERLVLAANGTQGVWTCALRPHLIVGKGDPHLVPRLVERARAGKLAVIGNGVNEVSLTHAANAARAHRLALEQLGPGAPHAGKAYFVCQKESVRLWEWIGELLHALGLPRPRRRVPLPVAYATGAALERAWSLFGRSGEPPMTRFVALQLARSHTYDVAPIERDLGYREVVGMEATTREAAASAASGD
jgi:nucleoside-diphosphate-sugar epimerase